MATRRSKEKVVFLIASLATGRFPTEVAKDYQELFEEEISRQAVNNYNAGHDVIRRRMTKTDIELFDKIRAEWLEGRVQPLITMKLWRQQLLQDQIDEFRSQIAELKALTKPNHKLISELRMKLALLLEQGAKEDGGIFTNKKELKVTEIPKMLIGISIEDV